MDGFKRRLKDSVQLRLSIWLAFAIIAVALVAGSISFASAYNEAHELQDETLRQIAFLFDSSHLPSTTSRINGKLNDQDEDERVIVQYLQPIQGMHLSGPLLLPATLQDGFNTLTRAGSSYRVFVRSLTSGTRIAIAQETDVRDDAAFGSALRTVMPIFVLVPLLLVVVARLVRIMFQPIADLSSEIDQRSELELHPLSPEPLPLEVRPFIVAINRLLGRVSQSVAAQRRFVADAAHELRSPLTALSLQAERLASADMSAAARERLSVLRKGIERSRSLLDQLLTLARTQSDTVPISTMVSVKKVYRHVLEDLMPIADEKHIDIGVEGDIDAEIAANEFELTTLVQNLVSNALRYTPEGGRVDLSLRKLEDRTVLQVVDSGPGIAPEERERVFSPFYRILGSDEIGSGLGLSIVKMIADRLGAQVHLAYANEQDCTGLHVTVELSTSRPNQSYPKKECI